MRGFKNNIIKGIGPRIRQNAIEQSCESRKRLRNFGHGAISAAIRALI